MLYLYAIAAELGDIAELRGVQGEPLVLIPFDDAVVVAGEVTAIPPLETRSLKAQDSLMRQLHNRAAALLPMRFGMTVREAAAIEPALKNRHISRKLQDVRGCEQMTLRITGAEPAQPFGGAEPSEAALSGTAYLMERAKRHRPSPEMADVASGAAAIVRGVHVEAVNQHGVHGSVYHLIERGHAEEYRRMIEEAAATLPGVHVIITGPSPAYAFA